MGFVSIDLKDGKDSWEDVDDNLYMVSKDDGIVDNIVQRDTNSFHKALWVNSKNGTRQTINKNLYPILFLEIDNYL